MNRTSCVSFWFQCTSLCALGAALALYCGTSRSDESESPNSDPLIEWAARGTEEFQGLLREHDQNNDGQLTAAEWRKLQFRGVIADLGDIPYAEWDRNDDGAVTVDECRFLLEVTYGVRRTDGQLLRRPTGHVIDWAYIRNMDKDGDDSLSRAEFVDQYYAGPKRNAELFTAIDTDKDGRATYKELAASPYFLFDALRGFARFDTNMDGRISQPELDAGARPWQASMAQVLIPAFDEDGDAQLDLQEYRGTPFANPLARWYVLHTDTDHDGRLSWTEYYRERSPLFYGLCRNFFRRFDRNGDDYLSHDEFKYEIKMDRVPAPVALAVLDKDGDGRLQLHDLVEPQRPKTNNPTARLRWEERTMRIEEAFRGADSDRNGELTAEELGNHQAAFTAAILGKAFRPSLARLTPPATSSPSATGWQT